MSKITKTERHELTQLIKKREKVMKTQAQERSAALLAEFEAQSAKIHHYDEDEVWQKAEEGARAAVDAANQQIAARCKKLGIPAEFAPYVAFGWSGRGHNAVSNRRDELRRAAKTKIALLEAEAISKIERMSLEAQTEIVSKGLESDAAIAFLNAMPALASLMPPIEVTEITSLIESRVKDRARAMIEHKSTWN